MSDKKTQILNLSPSTDLVFKGPFSEVVTSTLTLQNPTDDPVIFKVKTTAPRQYCVRPNSGLLSGLESVVISVMLQPLEGTSTGDRTKHKFMVQTMFAPQGFQLENLDIVWKESAKSQMMDSKLRCVFVEGQPPSIADSESHSTSVPLRISDEPMQPDETPLANAPSESTEEGQVQEVSEILLPSVDSSAVSFSTGGNNLAMEKATAESKVRSLQNKVDELTNTNKQLQSENSKMRQRFTPGAARIGGASPALKGGAASLARPKRHLSLVAIMLILVAIVLGYLVGKWL